jgi:hypothetical protein
MHSPKFDATDVTWDQTDETFDQGEEFVTPAAPSTGAGLGGGWTVNRPRRRVPLQANAVAEVVLSFGAEARATVRHGRTVELALDFAPSGHGAAHTQHSGEAVAELALALAAEARCSRVSMHSARGSVAFSLRASASARAQRNEWRRAEAVAEFALEATAAGEAVAYMEALPVEVALLAVQMLEEECA